MYIITKYRVKSIIVMCLLVDDENLTFLYQLNCSAVIKIFLENIFNIILFLSCIGGQNTLSLSIEIAGGIGNKRIFEGTLYFNLKSNNTVSISKVDSSIKIPDSLPDKKGLLPCEQTAYSVNGMFCIDNNFNLYATSKVEDFYLDQSTFNISLSVVVGDVKNITMLHLKFVDSCRAASKPYYDLRQRECTSFGRMYQTRFRTESPTEATLDISQIPTKQALGVRIPVSLLKLKPNNTHVLIVIDANTNVQRSFPLSYEKEDALYVSIYSFNFGVNGTAIRLNFKIQILKGPVLDVLLLAEFVEFKGPLTVWALDSWGWCSQIDCVDFYKEWKKAVSSTTDSRCKIDKNFIEPYFGQCTSKFFIRFVFNFFIVF